MRIRVCTRPRADFTRQANLAPVMKLRGGMNLGPLTPDNFGGALKVAAASGSLRDVVAAKARGGDPNWRDEGLDDGRTALHEAAAAGRAEVVAFLLLNGAVLDDEVHALAAATAKGVEISRILLEYDQGELW